METMAKEDKVTTTEASKAADVDNFEIHLRRIFYIRPTELTTKYNESVVQYFGVLSLTDLRRPERKLWYIYYCEKPKVDETVDRILAKYGKKNMYEIFRKPIFSGVGLRAIVKKHFAELKWYAKGNLLEAPPKSHFNDERVVKTVNDLYNSERQKLHNYVSVKHKWWKQFN